MAKIIFAPAIQRHVQIAEQRVSAKTLREALHATFAIAPALRDYVVDEQDNLRKHVTIFIDSEQIDQRRNLDQAISEDTDIYVVQALSGG